MATTDYKSTDALMRHLRNNGIAISGSSQKQHDYSVALKAPVRETGNQQSGCWGIIFNDSSVAEPLFRKMRATIPETEDHQLNYSLIVGSSPYTSLIERQFAGFVGTILIL